MNKRWFALVPLLVAAAMAAGCRSAPSSEAPKVVMIGLDGASWNFLDPLLRNDRLPNLARLLEGAAHGELATFRPTHSAILWTSIATGKTLEKHGVTDWTYVDDSDRERIREKRLVTGRQRVAATIWEILSDLGHTVGVVNWWVTYPARPVNGVVVSDRLKIVMNNRSVPEEPDVVYPPELVEELRPFFLRPAEVGPVLERFRFPGYSPERARELFDSSPASRNLFEALLSYVGQDQMVADWTRHLLRNGQPDFFATVVRLPDVLSHFGWRFANRDLLEELVPQLRIDSLTSADPEVRSRNKRLLRRLDRAVARGLYPAYAFADEMVGSVLSAIDTNTIVIVVSDHGQVWQGGGYDHNPAPRVDYPSVSPPGILIAKGPGVRAGEIRGATLFDIAPTVLYALGEPVGADMDGEVLTGLFDASFRSGRPVRYVDTHGTGAPQTGEGVASPEIDEAILEDLRNLGYLGGGETLSDPDPEGERER